MSVLIPGTRTAFVAAGSVYPNVSSSLIYLNGTCAATKFTTLRLGVATSGYAVTSGKTLFLLSLMIVGTGTGTAVFIGYGDTDVGVSGNSAPTNALPLNARILSIASTNRVLPLFFAIPASKYVYFNSDAQDSYLHMWGYEK